MVQSCERGDAIDWERFNANAEVVPGFERYINGGSCLARLFGLKMDDPFWQFACIATPVNVSFFFVRWSDENFKCISMICYVVPFCGCSLTAEAFEARQQVQSNTNQTQM